MVLDGKPDIPCRAAMDTNHILQLNGDGTKEPRQYNIVHALPYRGGSIVDVGEDAIAPPGVVGGEGVHDKRDKRSDVLDAVNLHVEVGDDGGLMDHNGLSVGEGSDGGLRQLESGDKRTLQGSDICLFLLHASAMVRTRALAAATALSATALATRSSLPLSVAATSSLARCAAYSWARAAAGLASLGADGVGDMDHNGHEIINVS